MNIRVIRLHCIVLFFSILLSVSIYSECSFRETSWSSQGNCVRFTPYSNQSQGGDFSSQRSSADYSCGSRWNDGGSHRSSVRPNNFAAYSPQDFQHHFARQGFTESEILNQRCLYMFDDFVKFAQTYSSYNSTIKEIYTALKNLSRFQKICCMVKGTYCPSLQKRINYLYNELSTIKAIPQNNNYTYAVPIKRESSKVARQFEEYKVLEHVYTEYAPSLLKAVKTRSAEYNNGASADHALHYARKSYNLNNNVKQLLSHYGHSTTRFAECYGSPLHQAIHQESLDILDCIDDLPHNSLLYDHQEALVDFAVAMVDYNHENMTEKAMTVGDFCWTLLDYGQAIGEGALLGAYSAAHDIIANPIEAAVCIVAGKEILAYQLCKVLYNVADIGVTAITDVDCAKEKWNKYAEPLNNIIDAINKKEITLRDGIKGGTALVVGCKVQGKLLGGLGKFCNCIKQKSIDFVKNSLLLKQTEYLTTPEGLLFKATSKSNKTNLSGSGNAVSHLKKSITNKISTNKNIKNSDLAVKQALVGNSSASKGIIRNIKEDLRSIIGRYERHIFSDEHKRDGILALGKDQKAIMESLGNTIMSLDKKGLLQEGSNQLKVKINGIDNVEIRCFIQGGEVISVNAFISNFGRIFNNFIDTTKV